MTARHYEGLKNGLTNITLYLLSHFKQCHFPSSRQFRMGPPIFIYKYIYIYIYIYIYLYIIVRNYTKCSRKVLNTRECRAKYSSK